MEFFASEFQRMVEGELLIMGFQQLDTFKTCVLDLTYSVWGANDVSAEERTST
jgi:hypothetical protein